MLLVLSTLALVMGVDQLDTTSTVPALLGEAQHQVEPGAPHHPVELTRTLRDRGRLDEAHREAERALAATAKTPLAHLVPRVGG